MASDRKRMRIVVEGPSTISPGSQFMKRAKASRDWETRAVEMRLGS